MVDTIKDMIEVRRRLSAERACKNALTDWGKNFWYSTFKKLCEKYNKMSYFNQVRGD